MVVALIFAQGMYMHVHTHDGDLNTLSHVHNGPVHVAFIVDQEHPDEEAIVDVELSKQGIVKNPTLSFAMLLLLSTFVLFLFPRNSTRSPFRPENHVLLTSRRIALIPPLRAPPQ